MALTLLLACNQTPKHEERPGMVYIPAGEFLMGSAADDPVVYPWEPLYFLGFRCAQDP